MAEARPDPDQLLERIKEDEARARIDAHRELVQREIVVSRGDDSRLHAELLEYRGRIDERGVFEIREHGVVARTPGDGLHCLVQTL